MADSTTLPFALYRFTTGSDTEANIADSEAIGLNYGITETSDAGVVAFNHGVPQRRTDVPNVGARTTTRPATTLVTVPIKFTVAINEKITDQAAIQARFDLFYALANSNDRYVDSIRFNEGNNTQEILTKALETER